MQLGDILDTYTLDVATAQIEIHDVQIDSRECTPGSLFFALNGANLRGATFVEQAAINGAVAIVTTELVELEGFDLPVFLVTESQIRPLLAHASAAVCGYPEVDVQLVGVTGTNGKTSVTTLVSQLAKALGWNSGNIGTLTSVRTTPDSPELFRTLRTLREGFTNDSAQSVVAMEVSSHALHQGRVTGLEFEIAAFTNLSHDHLDYHHTMEEYFEVKAQLFSTDHAKKAVVWADDDYGQRLIERSLIPTIAVSRTDASEVRDSLLGTTFFWREKLINSPLVGGYNVDNTLMALTIVSELGATDEEIALAMAGLSPVPGRFEVLKGVDRRVVVDYAHTPDGLQRLLTDVRSLAEGGRVITVFGCGGDRDQSKRPAMGRIASELSDIAIITSDNPRSESPDAIIEEVASGVVSGSTVMLQSDRRAAISEALTICEVNDVVVIAGKGHESQQIIGDQIVEFDDREVALQLMKRGLDA